MNDVATELYQSLLASSCKALNNCQYEVAFHALSAALHCACDLKDEQALLTVEQEAERQKAFIDAHSPTHRLSSQAAIKRGGKSLYDPMIAQAKVHLTQFSYDRHKQERLKQRPI